ncbi:MAG: hypothetical protein FXF49_07860, partial [Flexistipes sinusarabici]
MRRFVLVVLVAVSVFACGKKTQPVSKDSFSLPLPVERSVKITDKGVKIVNISDEYVMFAERAGYDDKGCLQKFTFLSRLKPEESFLDKGVKQGNRYVYRLSYYDRFLEVYSGKKNVVVTYSKPIEIKTFDYKVNDTVKAKLEITYPDDLEYYELYVNGRKLYEGRKYSITTALLNGEVNNIEIIPYDIYGNKGDVFKAKIDLTAGKFIPAPRRLRRIIGDSFVMISWESVEKAEKYKVYINKGSGFVMKAETETNFYRYKNKPEK